MVGSAWAQQPASHLHSGEYCTESLRGWYHRHGYTNTEPGDGWTVDLKSDNGEWIVRYAGFDKESADGEQSHHFVAGLPCDLDLSEGASAC